MSLTDIAVSIRNARLNLDFATHVARAEQAWRRLGQTGKPRFSLVASNVLVFIKQRALNPNDRLFLLACWRVIELAVRFVERWQQEHSIQELVGFVDHTNSAAARVSAPSPKLGAGPIGASVR